MTKKENDDVWNDAVVKTAWVEVDDILFNPNNYKIHPRAQQGAVESSIEKVGIVRRILINLRTSEEWDDNNRNVHTLIDGHLRVQLAARKGIKKLKADFIDLNPEQEDYLLSVLDPVGTMAVIDREKWGELAARMKKKSDNMTDKNVLDELAKKMKASKHLQRAELGIIGDDDEPSVSIENINGKLPGVKSLKDWVIFEMGLNPFDIPMLKEDMIMTIPPELQTYSGVNNEYKEGVPYLYMWGSDSTRSLDMRKTIIGFYVDDHRFENFWYYPSEYVGKLINASIMGAIMPNFSLAVDVPKVVRMWQRYRAVWCARYFQEAGIKVIPDIPLNWVDGDDILLGIPAGCNICTQLHTKMSEEDWESTLDYLEYIMNKHNPERFMIYADKPGWSMVAGRFDGDPIMKKLMWVQDRVGLRRSHMEQTRKEVFQAFDNTNGEELEDK